MDAPYTLGSYRLLAELGHGGMADVFLAAVEGPAGSGFTKLAVVKKLRSHLAEEPEFVSMLMDEARLTSRLSHPNVVQLFEVGHFDGQYFLAMEHLEGQPLHRIERRAIRRGANVSPEIYYAIVSDVLAGLHYAHELADFDGTPFDVVHRDVSPHNIFVTYDGAVKVVDFGLAKASGRATATQGGAVKGKFRYMSPEQAWSQDVDRRSDIFAVGLVLWNAATGAAFWGEQDDEAVRQTLFAGEFSISPRTLHPDVPEAIDAICRRALAFRREDRYGSAAEMRADLEAFLGHASADARTRLSSMMKELFTKDRAKLRKVLEASGLGRVPSVGLFTGAAGARKVKPGVARAPVRVGAAASHRRSARAAHDRSPAAVARARPRTDRPSEALAKRPGRLAKALAFAAAALVVAVAVRTEVTADSGAANPPRQAVTVSSGLATFSHHARLREPSASVGVGAELVHRGPSRVAPSAAAEAASEPPATAAALPSDVAEGRGPGRNARSIDDADPWDSGR